MTEQNLPCDGCRQPTEKRHPDGPDIPCCMERSCELWVKARLNFRNAPSVSWDEID